MAGHHDMVREMQSSLFHGEFIYKITRCSEIMQSSSHGGPQCISSQDFYIEPQSYKYHLELYPNGTGTGRGTHTSIRLVTLQGEYDRVLSWPPNFKMKISLLNQFGDVHLDYILGPDTEGNFTQPDWETFVLQSKLCRPHSIYVRDNVMFVKVTRLKNPVTTLMNSVSEVQGLNPE